MENIGAEQLCNERTEKFVERFKARMEKMKISREMFALELLKRAEPIRYPKFEEKLKEKYLKPIMDSKRRKNIECGNEYDDVSVQDEFQKFFDSAKKKAALVDNWKYGHNLPSWNNLFIICEILDCTTDYLFGYSDELIQGDEFIHDATGLSVDAIHKLRDYGITYQEYYNETKQEKWLYWIDCNSYIFILNKLIESDNLLGLLHDYVAENNDIFLLHAISNKADKCEIKTIWYDDFTVFSFDSSCDIAPHTDKQLDIRLNSGYKIDSDVIRQSIFRKIQNELDSIRKECIVVDKEMQGYDDE